MQHRGRSDCLRRVAVLMGCTFGASFGFAGLLKLVMVGHASFRLQMTLGMSQVLSDGLVRGVGLLELLLAIAVIGLRRHRLVAIAVALWLIAVLCVRTLLVVMAASCGCFGPLDGQMEATAAWVTVFAGAGSLLLPGGLRAMRAQRTALLQCFGMRMALLGSTLVAASIVCIVQVGRGVTACQSLMRELWSQGAQLDRSTVLVVSVDCGLCREKLDALEYPGDLFSVVQEQQAMEFHRRWPLLKCISVSEDHWVELCCSQAPPVALMVSVDSGCYAKSK